MIRTSEQDRTAGIVYLDERLVARPATHVMIVGVGSFSSDFIADVTSPTVSARAVADWFVQDMEGFHNPATPLGSVTVLLSEAGEGQAEYAGGTVPRALFANARSAMQAWVRRSNSHKENMMILYVASHGESHGRRTAFLLEDFGSNEEDVTSGMSEVEQLIGALENAVPTSQLLLFDCCRSPTAVELPWDAQFGTQLVSLSRKQDDHGEIRRQWALCSTALGEEALGRRGKTTLFAECVLAAMSGIASDPSGSNWPVRPGALLDRVAQLLRLHARPEETIQTPAGRAAGTFDIHFSGDQPARAYISLHDRAAWPGARISVRDGETVVASKEGLPGEPAFTVVDLEELQPVTITAERFGDSLGSERITPRAPVAFVELGGTLPVSVDRTAVGGESEQAEFRFAVAGQRLEEDSLVLSVTKVGTGAAGKSKNLVLGTVRSETLLVSPGEYTLEFAFPDGSVFTQQVTAAQDDAISVTAKRSADRPSETWLGHLDLATSPDVRNRGTSKTLTTPPSPSLEVLEVAERDGGLSINETLSLSFDPWDSPRKRPLLIGSGVVPLLRYDTADRMVFEPTSGQPIWTVVRSSNRLEMAALPTPIPFAGPSEWSAYLIVDPSRPSLDFATQSVIESQRWAGLFGYLANRDFGRGNEVLKSLMRRGQINEAIRGKRSNPYAAVAGALVAVAAGVGEGFPIQWLENLVNWFPELPDGPVILSRRLLMQKSPDLDRVQDLLITGFDRGVPAFSLSCDWLSRGFEAVGRADEVTSVRKAQARRLAARIDARQAFTVLRLR
jgi:hypothetical protein